MIVEVSRDSGTGATVASLVGQLTLATVPDLQATLRKLAAECPTALILDLQSMSSARASLLAMFAVTARGAVEDHGVPVLVCGCADEVADSLWAHRSLLTVHASREAAAAVVRAAELQWRHHRLEPAVTAASEARRLVHEACVAWGVAHLDDAARLVASELVNNAVIHAGTTLDITVASNGRFLRIAVQDGSSVQPRLVLDSLLAPALAKHGWGLRLVQRFSTRWGSTLIDSGKIVWAHLAVDRMPPPLTDRFTHAG
jgi:anti-anti-sigma regulatory factor/anti-sigma regulatory factor (Ser/Thr protein kinase)